MVGVATQIQIDSDPTHCAGPRRCGYYQILGSASDEDPAVKIRTFKIVRKSGQLGQLCIDDLTWCIFEIACNYF